MELRNQQVTINKPTTLASPPGLPKTMRPLNVKMSMDAHTVLCPLHVDTAGWFVHTRGVTGDSSSLPLCLRWWCRVNGYQCSARTSWAGYRWLWPMLGIRPPLTRLREIALAEGSSRVQLYQKISRSARGFLAYKPPILTTVLLCENQAAWSGADSSAGPQHFSITTFYLISKITMTLLIM